MNLGEQSPAHSLLVSRLAVDQNNYYGKASGLSTRLQTIGTMPAKGWQDFYRVQMKRDRSAVSINLELRILLLHSGIPTDFFSTVVMELDICDFTPS
jgi:hypothetical protein